MRRLVAAVNDPVKLADENWVDFYHLEDVTVCGEGPPLEDEDLSWFEKYEGKTRVAWDVENGDGYTIERVFPRHSG